MSWTSWSTRSAASLVKWHIFGSFDFIGSKIKGISKPVTTFRIIGSFFSFCQFLMKYFALPALGSCLIFPGNKFTINGCILQNSDGGRRSVKLMGGTINKFFSYSFPVLLVGYCCWKVWPAAMNIPLSLVLNRMSFWKSWLLFPSLDDPSFFTERKGSFDLFFKLKLLTTSSSYLGLNNTFSEHILCFWECFSIVF